MLRRLIALSTSFALAAAIPWGAQAEPLALTFDDLPALSLTHDLAYTRETLARLQAGLMKHRFPAIGFVNGGKLVGSDEAERIALLKAWRDAGFELGNHTFSHISLNRVPVEAYEADVEAGDTAIGALAPRSARVPRWFRHPYLETGLTAEVRSQFETWLSAHDFRVAPVTLENSDWMFAYPYDEAVLAQDTAAAARIRAEYVAFTSATIRWYQLAAYTLFARRPALVFLLHASRLNADCLDDLADRFAQAGLRPVSLAQALRDPVYATPDAYAGPDGDEWLSRWSVTLKRDLPWASLPAPPQDIVTAELRLDPAPSSAPPGAPGRQDLPAPAPPAPSSPDRAAAAPCGPPPRDASAGA